MSELLLVVTIGGRRAAIRAADVQSVVELDAVIPVPLHPFRAMQRGFNQSDDLARELGLPVWRVLCRVRHGPPQATLPAARRNANVRAAFRLSWHRHLAVRVLPALHLRNRVVVLIDDVMTTGETALPEEYSFSVSFQVRPQRR